MVAILIARAYARFARPNIQIYDVHVVDLYQWARARYLAGVKGAEDMAERVGFEPTVRFPAHTLSKRAP